MSGPTWMENFVSWDEETVGGPRSVVTKVLHKNGTEAHKGII